MAIEGNPKVIAQGIAEGYGIFTSATLKKYTRQDLHILKEHISIVQREIRGEQVDLEDILAIKKKNMRIQRLSQALSILDTYCKKNRIII
jgi:hypothetical protein